MFIWLLMLFEVWIFFNFIYGHFIQFNFFIRFDYSIFNCSISMLYTFLNYYFFSIPSLLILLHLFFKSFFVLILLIAIYFIIFLISFFFNFVSRHLISFGFLSSFGPHSFNKFFLSLSWFFCFPI